MGPGSSECGSPRGGADASGLGFRHELDPGTKTPPPNTAAAARIQTRTVQSTSLQRSLAWARGGEPAGLPPVGRELEGLCFLHGSACFWKGGDSTPQKPLQSRGACGFPSTSPWESSGSQWLQVSTPEGQPSCPWDPTRLLSSIAPDGGTSPPWPPGGTSGPSATQTR